MPAILGLVRNGTGRLVAHSRDVEIIWREMASRRRHFAVVPFLLGIHETALDLLGKTLGRRIAHQVDNVLADGGAEFDGEILPFAEEKRGRALTDLGRAHSAVFVRGITVCNEAKAEKRLHR